MKSRKYQRSGRAAEMEDSKYTKNRKTGLLERGRTKERRARKVAVE